jgi:YVTN family beta-propeller protein
MKRYTKLIPLIVILSLSQLPAEGLDLKKVIRGNISPKSVVHSGKGLFFAQNMMYRHTITVYDRQYQLVKTIPDSVILSDFGDSSKKGTFRGSPVEVAFSHDGKYAWVSNYCMFGPGFHRPGHDRCTPAGNYDRSYLYKINTESLKIEEVIRVGSVPKFVATTPNNKLVLVSNWCSWDLSVVDTNLNREVRRVKIGRYPRGIVVSPDSSVAYIAVMGSYNIAVVTLQDFTVSWIKGVGHSPRHLNLDPQGKYLYATLNGEASVAKIDTDLGRVLRKVSTGSAPRSMTISDDGRYLYVVNYKSNTMSKVRTSDMKVLQTVKTGHHPIGITYDPVKREVWVACYGGCIMVFRD